MSILKSRELYQRGRLILLFEPRDLWVGVYVDTRQPKPVLYVCLLPCLPIRWRFADW